MTTLFKIDKLYVLFTLALGFLLGSCDERKVDFNTEVRPILNKSCISCHGGVKQSGGFGLVFRENALSESKNGNFGIVPGHPEKSEMISRINHKNPELRMPLEKDPLTQEEIDLLTTWVKQGAQWDDHWAYLKPKHPELPQSNSDWTENEIDHFILEKMQVNDLTPSEQANAHDLVRRVYLDLTGLPPTLNQVNNYVSDKSENAYEKLVDDLLTSPNYGEHWASMWLDLARYADSKGYEADRKRVIWKYRDWVIKAFNNDMPFDQFTIEQLAGDLLPNPTIDQLIATAFHRNTLNNSEGGTDNEEYRISSVIDRVNTTWEVWQSTTMGCVQCHSHPYDPIRHEEYYSSFAFFNNTSDWDVNTDHPLLKELNESDRAQLDEVKKYITNLSSNSESSKWEKFLLTGEPKLRPEDFEEAKNIVHHNRGNQDYMVIHNEAYIKIKDVLLVDVDRIYLSYFQRWSASGELIITTDSLNGSIIGKKTLKQVDSFLNVPIKLSTEKKAADLYFQFKSKVKNYSCVIDGFLLSKRLPEEDRQVADRMYQKIDELINAPYEISTPIMVEKPESHSRKSHVFVRGNWLVKGDEVSPGVPKLFDQTNRELTNRLDLANWLISDENPLSGRVMVNRFWSKMFGIGIVRTVEDFGTLGDYPSHPELLDWMAIKFSGEWKWSVKKLLKTIAMSATYRQSAKITAEKREKDPDNKWLSRSPRVRLSAEQIRDQALAVSGLLSEKMYGPSVMPHQPEGVWSVVYNSDTWSTSEGEDAYRRGLYTYLRRSSPYPSFISFDAASREYCLSRRIITNTPLQALITLNDPVYFEAARNLAKQITEVDGDKKKKITTAYNRIMGKSPNSEKTDILLSLFDKTSEYYEANKREAYEIAKAENLELASLTVVVNALMNMDEFTVKN
ncbi:MAG: DUF1553 domain-containing protein [Cyclobacteriaceae bacterium]